MAVAEPDGEVHSLGTIANREESIRKLIRKLGPAEQLRTCYEAGPTGFVLYWQLAQLGVECEHEGESSAEVCVRLSRTRVSSQRQLPTDHDYAVPTREYRLDQSSPIPATAAADPVLERQEQRQNKKGDWQQLTRSLHNDYWSINTPYSPSLA
jgi:hypothetical protein